MSKVIYSKEHKFLIEQLKRSRKDLGFKQIEVGRLLGKTQSFISKIEAGQIKIDIVLLKKFAHIYGKK